MSNQALARFTVLDLSESIAGQFCCRMMADFGADVTLVEPSGGSRIRSLAPFDPQDNNSLLFFHLNHGKKSIALDHTTEQGWNDLLNLSQTVDAIVVGTGIDRAKIAARSPGCVVALVSDFGDDGPCANWRGSEMIFQALSGMMHVNGRADRQPLYGVGHRASYAAGVGAYITLLSALYAAKSTGRGQLVDLDVAMNTSSMAPPSSLEFAYSGIRSPRGEERSPFMSLECRDGWVGVWIYPHTWSPFCHAIGRPELAEDPRFSNSTIRQQHWADAKSIVQTQVASWESDALVERLMKERVLVAKAYRALELWDKVQHLKDRDYWSSVDTLGGKKPILGPQFRLSATPRQVTAGAPAIGSTRYSTASEISDESKIA